LEAGSEVVAADLAAAPMAGLAAAGAEVVMCDVTQPEQREDLARASGEVDFLVNCHGVIGVMRLEDASPPEWDRIHAVNAKATFFLMQSFMPLLREGGAVVNIASTAGKTASTVEVAIYNCSKAAVIAMTKSYAYALAPRNVRVNCVCPGDIDTAMQGSVTAGLAALRETPEPVLIEGRVAGIPLARVGEAHEVAGVVTFLLSDAARYMTGQAVNVSGGLVMY
jgi:NAD(P)-dependent dehydrogenase (short-subunit alcohol dehydrogenase family)